MEVLAAMGWMTRCCKVHGLLLVYTNTVESLHAYEINSLSFGCAGRKVMRLSIVFQVFMSRLCSKNRALHRYRHLHNSRTPWAIACLYIHTHIHRDDVALMWPCIAIIYQQVQCELAMYRRLHNPCNTDWIITPLVQCERNLMEV